MANRSCYELAAIFFENWLKNEVIVQRRKLSMLWRCSGFPCGSRYAVRSQADSQLCVGSFNGPDQ